jgi:hypothetical protein
MGVRATFKVLRGRHSTPEDLRAERQRSVAKSMLNEWIQQAEGGWTRKWLRKLQFEAGISSAYPLVVLALMLIISVLVWILFHNGDSTFHLIAQCASPYLVLIFGLIVASIMARRRLRSLTVARFKVELQAMPVNGPTAIQRAENLLAYSFTEGQLITQRLLRDVLIATIFAVPAVSLATYGTLEGVLVPVIVAGACFETLALAGWVVIRQRMGELEGDLRQSDYERSLLIEGASNEDRAEKLFLRQQYEVKRYYDETLRQSAVLSYIGVLCIAGGFAVIGVAFALVISKGADTTQQVIVAALGAAGGILANFVAVVFLRMHSGTVRALTSFHERLVSTHHVHFGDLLASRLDDKTNRHAVLGDMAIQLSGAAQSDQMYDLNRHPSHDERGRFRGNGHRAKAKVALKLPTRH